MSKEVLTNPLGYMTPEWAPTMQVVKRDSIKTFSGKYMGTATTITDVRSMWEMAGGYCHDHGIRNAVST